MIRPRIKLIEKSIITKRLFLNEALLQPIELKPFNYQHEVNNGAVTKGKEGGEASLIFSE